MTALKRFDTLKSYNALKKSGVSENQAETLVEMIREATDSSIEHLATREDLANAKAELKEDIVANRAELASVKAELKEDITSVRVELVSIKSELKEDIAAVRTEMAEIKGNVNILTKAVVGFCFVVAINIILFWFHH